MFAIPGSMASACKPTAFEDSVALPVSLAALRMTSNLGVAPILQPAVFAGRSTPFATGATLESAPAASNKVIDLFADAAKQPSAGIRAVLALTSGALPLLLVPDDVATCTAAVMCRRGSPTSATAFESVRTTGPNPLGRSAGSCLQHCSIRDATSGEGDDCSGTSGRFFWKKTALITCTGFLPWNGSARVATSKHTTPKLHT